MFGARITLEDLEKRRMHYEAIIRKRIAERMIFGRITLESLEDSKMLRIHDEAKISLKQENIEEYIRKIQQIEKWEQEREKEREEEIKLAVRNFLDNSRRKCPYCKSINYRNIFNDLNYPIRMGDNCTTCKKMVSRNSWLNA